VDDCKGWKYFSRVPEVRTGSNQNRTWTVGPVRGSAKCPELNLEFSSRFREISLWTELNRTFPSLMLDKILHTLKPQWLFCTSWCQNNTLAIPDKMTQVYSAHILHTSFGIPNFHTHFEHVQLRRKCPFLYGEIIMTHLWHIRVWHGTTFSIYPRVCEQLVKWTIYVMHKMVWRTVTIGRNSTVIVHRP
jgi:hypothetical protein